ncbi:unnamed protein product [Symbiodinium sp. CCMP2592]|nr:unnamed protein product [Symbiodinium sp. CCMP2592]
METVASKQANPCVFTDITDIVPKGSWNSEDPFEQKACDIDRAPFFLKARCVTHGRLCPLFAVNSDLDVAGLPCVDYSKSGKGRREEGPTAPVFCCHAKLHVEKATPLLIIENVQELSMEMIYRLYGGHYNITRLLCDTADVGHAGTSRSRLYLILFHKHRVVMTQDVQEMYSSIAAVLRDAIQTVPSDYIVSEPGEIDFEVQQLCITRRKQVQVTQRRV